MKTIRAKQAIVDFAYFSRRNEHGIIAKHLTLTQSSILKWRFITIYYESQRFGGMRIKSDASLHKLLLNKWNERHKYVTIWHLIVSTKNVSQYGKIMANTQQNETLKHCHTKTWCFCCHLLLFKKEIMIFLYFFNFFCFVLTGIICYGWRCFPVQEKYVANS